VIVYHSAYVASGDPAAPGEDIESEVSLEAPQASGKLDMPTGRRQPAGCAWKSAQP